MSNYGIVLSDILSNNVASVASGPLSVNNISQEKIREILKRYNLEEFLEEALALTTSEQAKEDVKQEFSHVQIRMCGHVSALAKSVQEACEKKGYRTKIVAEELECEAKEAGKLIGAIAKQASKSRGNRAYIFAGETLVSVKGSGKGGRNQELALAAMEKIEGLSNVLIMSINSDGTDGPTDAAGAIVDGKSFAKAKELGLNPDDFLQENNAYPILDQIDALVKTGPTGSNVNDFTLLLLRENVEA